MSDYLLVHGGLGGAWLSQPDNAAPDLPCRTVIRPICANPPDPVPAALRPNPHLVALVRAGAKFENGKLVERPDDTTATEEAA